MRDTRSLERGNKSEETRAPHTTRSLERHIRGDVRASHTYAPHTSSLERGKSEETLNDTYEESRARQIRGDVRLLIVVIRSSLYLTSEEKIVGFKRIPVKYGLTD